MQQCSRNKISTGKMQQDAGRETLDKMREDETKNGQRKASKDRKGKINSGKKHTFMDRIGWDGVRYSVCEGTPGIDLFRQQDHLQQDEIG